MSRNYSCSIWFTFVKCISCNLTNDYYYFFLEFQDVELQQQNENRWSKCNIQHIIWHILLNYMYHQLGLYVIKKILYQILPIIEHNGTHFNNWNDFCSTTLHCVEIFPVKFLLSEIFNKYQILHELLLHFFPLH